MADKWCTSSVTLVFVAVFLMVAVAIAGPVLHEQFASDPAEDMRLGATTRSGQMPAALETRSGLVPAPEEELDISAADASARYGGARTAQSHDTSFHLDRITTRPSQVKYDEPFRPSIIPYKRLYAFDAIVEDWSLLVRDKSLSAVEVGGQVAENEDAFYADFVVDLVAGVAVRIPSVGPGARILALQVDPPLPVSVVRDGADNWFARAEQSKSVRVLMQLALHRQTFGSQFLPVSFQALSPYVAPLTDEMKSAAREVAAHIGVSREFSPAGAVKELVGYFRKFAESSEISNAEGQAQLYRELSMMQKGVCRHRAYAFFVTATFLGIPTRVVYNEAHAWVEVYDTELWHRVDLGGAAMDIQTTRRDPAVPAHRPPGDPYSWPSTSRPAALEFARSLEAAQKDAEQSLSLSRTDGKVGSDGERASADEAGPAAGDGSRGPSSSSEPSDITLTLEHGQVTRGKALSVQGVARRGDKICALSRIDILLLQEGETTNLGSVATDLQGAFRGEVTVPLQVHVGESQIMARLSAGCR